MSSFPSNSITPSKSPLILSQKTSPLRFNSTISPSFPGILPTSSAFEAFGERLADTGRRPFHNSLGRIREEVLRLRYSREIPRENRLISDPLSSLLEEFDIALLLLGKTFGFGRFLRYVG